MPSGQYEDLAIIGNLEVRGALRGPGSPGGFQPGDQGFAGWNVDPLMAVGTTGVLTIDGVVILVKVRAAMNALCATITYRLVSAGTSMSNTFVGLYSTAGAKLGESADESTAWQSSGIKNSSLATPVEVVGGTNYYAAFLYNTSGTHPALSAVSAAPLLNVGTVAASRRELTSGTGQTALPASITISSGSATTMGIWAGIREA